KTKNGTDKKQSNDKKAAPTDAKKSSYQANPSKRLFQLTAFEQKADDTPAETSEKTAASAKNGDKAPEPEATKSEDKPAATATAKTSSAKSAASPAAPAPTASSTSKGSAAAPATPASNPKPEPAKPDMSSSNAAENKKPVHYQPLSEVKDEIRRTIAETKVSDQLQKLTEDIQIQLDGAFSRYNDKLVALAENEKPPAPPKALTDLEAIAQKDGLKYGRTGPKSLLQLRDLPVGKTRALDSNQSLLAILFTTRELALFQPIRTVDVVSKNLYVVENMSDTPARIPELSEVRGEVIRAWKEEKAGQLAEKHAEELAKKAQASNQPLTKFFADNKSIKVVTTDPFSELTGGEASPITGQIQPLRYSQPDGIVAAGPDFLKRLFELKEGEVAAIPNNDHSITYIVRVVSHQMGRTELRTAYLSEARMFQFEDAMNPAHEASINGSIENDVIARANLKWNRVPDKKALEEGGEG
ncbi:MAG TPA: hypothetical protein VHE81_03195, partial [Lacipirellulaceae bacterium]|nr:hypothetical protein [Lacipirellulaceae bacterium]